MGRLTAVLVLALAGACLASCETPPEQPPEPWPPATTAAPPPAAPSPWVTSSDGRRCVAPLPGRQRTYRPAPCDDPAAVAYELKSGTASTKWNGRYQPDCPDSTDFNLDVEAHPFAEIVNGSEHRDYSCMRRLKPPHRDDPGGGAPPLVSGDCLYTVDLNSTGPVRLQTAGETPCAGGAPGAAKPMYEVLEIVDGVRDCPAGTDEIFTQGSLLGGFSSSSAKVCAREL